MCFFVLARTGISASHQSLPVTVPMEHLSPRLFHASPPSPSPYISPDNEAGISTRDTYRSCAPMSHSDCAFPFSCPPVSPLRQIDIIVSARRPFLFSHPLAHHTRTSHVSCNNNNKKQIPVFVSVCSPLRNSFGLEPDIPLVAEDVSHRQRTTLPPRSTSSSVPSCGARTAAISGPARFLFWQIPHDEREILQP